MFERLIHFFRGNKTEHGHTFEEFSDGYKRKCKCGREEWLFENPYPAIGEPKHEWKDMTPRSYKFMEKGMDKCIQQTLDVLDK